jgi:hypothetical protein
MTPHGLMAIPRPHLLILERLRAQRAADRHGLIGWMGAVPEELKGLDANLLFVPLLQRGLIEDGSAVYGDAKAGGHFVRITAVGQQCYVYGYMPIEAVPVDEGHLELMSHAPSPMELAETVDGGLIVVDEALVESGPDA